MGARWDGNTKRQFAEEDLVPAMSLTHNPTGRLAAEHPGVVKLGRAGWFAKGVVYLLAGLLALVIVGQSFGWTPTGGAQEASPTGAIKEIGQSAGGAALLWALAIGLFIYSAWRVVTAALPGSTDVKGSVTRIGYLVSAVIYATFGLTAISVATSQTTSENGNQKVTDLTARIMSHSAGRWLIGLAGAIAVGAAIYRVVKGIKVDVNDELDLTGMSPLRLRWTQRLGALGEIGRGIAIGLIGFFLIRAALTFDPAQATGLDGALRRAAVEWWGVLLVAIVGLGFAAYGVFCLTTFTRRRLQAP
jgi:Domain of Unknown Function (DUF1206)